MQFREYRYLVYSDLYRVSGRVDFRALLRHVLLGEAFKYIFWMRTCRFLQGKWWAHYTVYPIALWLLSHYTYKFGIGIPFTTEIGPGLFIGHFGGIFIYPDCRIGKNCNLSQGVTLGVAPRGKNKGFPILGDNVYVGPGAKIVGAVCIGNDVAIGANAVVTHDVPDGAVAVGIPAKVISLDGSQGYIGLIDYDKHIG